VFSGYGLYDKIKPLMDKDISFFPGGEKPPLALMIEWGTEAYIPNVRFVSLPVQSLSIANVLNGKADSKGYVGTSGTIRFTVPGARLLIVDDMFTNLKVAEGLLAPYHAMIDTCLSGSQAVELVKRNDYDIVFMDHMMPEMDGIETTAYIREWEESTNAKRRVPIIALTANAVSGMREMFIEKGFDDFLAKPIDVSKLDEMLDRWIAKEKRERGKSEESGGGVQQLPAINDVDTAKGISMTGGTLDNYRLVLSVFRKDVKERLAYLEENPLADMKLFVTQVHAIKSASASIGAAELSADAARLESAGKSADTAFIRENLGNFTRRLSKVIDEIGAALETYGTGGDQTQDGFKAVFPLLRELDAVLKSQNFSEIDRILNEIDRMPLSAKAKETMEKISDDVLMAKFDSAVKTIDSLLKK
jgi:CheY-like chemotaxis protein